MDTYTTIENTAKQLTAAVVTKKLSGKQIEEKEQLLVTCLAQYAAENGIPAAVPMTKAYRRQAGDCPDKCAMDACDMLTGCLNRMSIADTMAEKQRMYQSAMYRIKIITDTAKEAIGLLTIPEYEWVNTLEL